MRHAGIAVQMFIADGGMVQAVGEAVGGRQRKGKEIGNRVV